MALLTIFLLQNQNETKFCTCNNETTKSIGYRGSSVLYNLNFIAYLKQYVTHSYLVSLKSSINIQDYGIFILPVIKMTVLQEVNLTLNEEKVLQYRARHKYVAT